MMMTNAGKGIGKQKKLFISQTDSATVEINVEVPQESRNRSTIGLYLSWECIKSTLPLEILSHSF